MEGSFEEKTGKMGLGLLRYSERDVVCLIDSVHAGKNSRELTGIDRDAPVVGTLQEAQDLGANVLVLGIAPSGGLIPPTWKPWLDEAVSRGFSIVNGLHDPLSTRYTALRLGQWIWDIRKEPEGLQPGTGAARELTNTRVLMIGTDMSVGKMTAGLEIHKAARRKGVDAAFVATGQIGITIMGRGVPLDAVRLDFAAGAIEKEMLAVAGSDLVIVEGQGSLIHPGSSANLPLIRGSFPTHFVLCHRAGMERLPRLEWVKVPPLREVMGLYEDLAAACGAFHRPSVSCVALNTGHLDDAESAEACRRLEDEVGMPVADPVRDGAERLLATLGF
jgi:uncharacterized NAD-dependent epimerase/dehydratase family protein